MTDLSKLQRLPRYDGIKYSVIDTETTGLEFDARILEIAVVQCTENFIPVHSYSTLVECKSPIPEFITNINGIDNAMVDKHNAPSWRIIWPHIASMLDNTILVGHFVEFDIRMMGQMVVSNYAYPTKFYPGYPIDTKVLAGGLRMKDCIEKYDINIEDEHGYHSALYDAQASAIILKDELSKIRDLDMFNNIPRPCHAGFPEARR